LEKTFVKDTAKKLLPLYALDVIHTWSDLLSRIYAKSLSKEDEKEFLELAGKLVAERSLSSLVAAVRVYAFLIPHITEATIYSNV
jgi:hypothetical protein